MKNKRKKKTTNYIILCSNLSAAIVQEGLLII